MMARKRFVEVFCPDADRQVCLSQLLPDFTWLSMSPLGFQGGQQSGERSARPVQPQIVSSFGIMMCPDLSSNSMTGQAAFTSSDCFIYLGSVTNLFQAIGSPSVRGQALLASSHKSASIA